MRRNFITRNNEVYMLGKREKNDLKEMVNIIRGLFTENIPIFLC